MLARTNSGFYVSDLFLKFNFLYFVSGMRSKLLKLYGTLDKVFDDILKDQEQRRIIDKGDHGQEEDLLDVLIQVKNEGGLEFPITNNNIKAIFVDIFAGGTNRSSYTIEWAMTEMIRHPRVMMKEQCKIGGYGIPVKTKVIVNAFACSTDPEYWEDAETFKLERFDNSSVNFIGSNYKFIPFGSGRRMCLDSGSKETEMIMEKLNSLSEKGDHQNSRSVYGLSMNFLSLNIQGLAQKAKKDWIQELAMKHKVNFLSIQETKMEEFDVGSVQNCWDYFVIVHGKWLKSDIDLLIVAIYVPHDPRDKRIVWDYLTRVINQWNGSVVIMGDFNDVRFKSERFGSIFNKKGADEFNSFIANLGLDEIPLGGSNFTGVTSFSKFIDDTWNLAPVKGTNALCRLMNKLKFLKNRIKEWIKVSKVKTYGDTHRFNEELRILDEEIDKGEGSDLSNISRLELINEIKRSEQLKAMETAQKSKIKWAIEGDENSRFFHVKHEFYNHFRDRFANSAVTRISIDMSFPKQISYDQKVVLERDLTKDELKAAVWDCGTDKSPGGNPSLITLILKIPTANLVKDFRPICLIGSIYKIIAKILANRLVGVLDNIIHERQSLIFKVDFEKAFDSVRWDFLDDVLKKFGFSNKWCDWIRCCLTSSRGSILVNGSPTEEFQFQNGLKQGDPLSPFLFILIMESLHLSFQRVVESGLFKGLNLNNTVCLSHMFYADDVVFVGKSSVENINTLTNVLDCFHRASGLKINMSKSKIMGVNVDGNKVTRTASKLGCLSLSSPFSYLGTKVGDFMSCEKAWKEVVDKVKNRLTKWKMKALSIGGRLTLLKSVLGSIPIYHMSIFRVPLKVLRSLEALRGHFFNGHETGSKKASWVNWEKVLSAKDKGGLRVASLFALNRGLLVKWVWRFYNHETSLWKKVIQAIHGCDGNMHKPNMSAGHSCWIFIVKEIRRLGATGINIFDFMKQKVGNGNNIKFWTDNWYHGGLQKDICPRLFALENRKDIVISFKLGDPFLYSSFRRDIRGGSEMEQFQLLVEAANSISLVPMEDRDKTRWVKFVPIKINVFAWKVMVNALPTRFNLSRRGIDIQSISCPMCDCGTESMDHVFARCDLIWNLGRLISNWWNTPFEEVDSIAAWNSWFSSIRLAPNLKLIFEGVCSGDFSVASIRRKIDDSRLSTVGDKTRWVKFVPIKINVFAWKVMVNALPTRSNLSRRGIDIQSIFCPMCDCGTESMDHVFARCDLTRNLGRLISNWWNTPFEEVDSIAAWKSWFSSIRLAPNLKLIFEGVWYTMWWHVWTYRNKL
nr:RNA-directed DNA polymerase, eukaryota, reverse transcriptase zinc-binding domain protein [Tanacetum cinerariifolium]